MPYRNGRFEEPTNEDRAGWALVAVNAFAAVTHYAPDEQSVTMDELSGNEGFVAAEYIGDLLCNLMHLCDATDVSFEDMVRCAREHYDVEESDDEDEEEEEEGASS